MNLKEVKPENLWKIRDALVKEYQRRDQVMQDRRDVRYRRMESELKALPLNDQIDDQALLVHQTEMPNQEVHKRVKRLVANKPRFEVVMKKSDPDMLELGQKLEDGIKAMYKWLNRGKVPFDWKVTQYQQGDGIGIGKLDFTPDHGNCLADYDLDDLGQPDEEEFYGELPEEAEEREKRNEKRATFRDYAEISSEQEAYDVMTEDALRDELPPFRLVAVDPATCYWEEDDDGVTLMVEHGKKTLHPLFEAFADYKLRLVNNRLVIDEHGTDAVVGPTYSSSLTLGTDLGREVEYTEIRTRDHIAMLISHPDLEKGAPEAKTEGVNARGVHIVFDNPFGPYTTGYVTVPGDVTTEAAHEDAYHPPVLGVLNTAQAQNVLMTARISAALAEALAPAYVEVKEEPITPASDEDKTPEVDTNKPIATVQGQIKRVEPPNADLGKAEDRLREEGDENRVRESLLGDATADTSGHRLSIQVAQADIQMVPYQNARSEAMVELMKGIVYAVRKHGLNVYIPTLPDSVRKSKGIRVAEPAVITTDMADLPFELVITLGAETPITKFAKWQALATREAEGSLGYQTLIEESDIENPIDEIYRVFEGKMLKEVMNQSIPKMVELVMRKMEDRFMQATSPQGGPTAGQAEGMGGIPPGTGMAGGGGAPAGPDDLVRLPGVNMPTTQSVPTRDAGVPGVPATGGDMTNA
jgi:hypothetical protein